MKLPRFTADNSLMSGVIPSAVQKEQYLLRIALHSESTGTMSCAVNRDDGLVHNYILKPGEWSSGMWVSPGQVVSYDCYCSSGGHRSGRASNGMVLKCPM
jgi:hypothetical protein